MWSPAEGEAETAVVASEVVIKLRGVKTVEAKVARLEKEIASYQERYDKALEAGKKAQAEAAEKRLSQRQEQLKAARESLQAFVIIAPKAGLFTSTVKPGQKIEAGAVVGMISGEPVRRATFKVPDSTEFSEGDDIDVAPKAEPKAAAGCKVSVVDDGSIEVACGGDLEPGPVVLPKVLVPQ
ncbi:MAG: hypothetical protein KJO07_23505 [Deltaproteobacteria bacterium]|nr:hypothetical protein [Deltaproteobacteria bacterium]